MTVYQYTLPTDHLSSLNRGYQAHDRSHDPKERFLAEPSGLGDERPDTPSHHYPTLTPPPKLAARRDLVPTLR